MSPRGLGKDGQAEEFWVFSCWIRVCLCSAGSLLISTISIECLFWTRLFTRLWATVGTGHPGWFLEVCQLGFLFTELGIFHLPSRSIFISLFWKADHITGSLAIWHLVGLSCWPTGESSTAGPLGRDREMSEVGGLDSSGLPPTPQKATAPSKSSFCNFCSFNHLSHIASWV